MSAPEQRRSATTPTTIDDLVRRIEALEKAVRHQRDEIASLHYRSTQAKYPSKCFS